MGNERTGIGTTASLYYSAFGFPQGIQCMPYQPRCPFRSTPTDGSGNFAPLGGSPSMALYCTPYTVFGTRPRYRNPGFFTSGGQPGATACSAKSTDEYGGKGLVQAGQPITGTWIATTTSTPMGGLGGGFNFPAARATGSAGVRATGVIGERAVPYPYVYSYTYATLRNDQGIFGPGSGPGSFSFSNPPGGRVIVKQGAAKFGGTMRMLGALTNKHCGYSGGGCWFGQNNWRYEVVGASANTMTGVVTLGYIATYLAYYYHTGLMWTSTVDVYGSRFPWTTGSVTVTAEGRGGHQTVHYAQGFDNRSSTSGKGTIQLVTPVLTRWLSASKNFGTAGIGILRIKFVGPPPSSITPILQPASASTDMGNAGAISNVIDQSGLSAGYASEVTDFDFYIASAPLHDMSGGGLWGSSSGTTTGNVDFDLGGTFLIRSFALWNLGGGWSVNITGITLLADDNASFSSPVDLGSFAVDPNAGPVTSVPAEVFGFTVTSASHVRMQITSDNGDVSTAFKEAAFEVLVDSDDDGIPDVFETDTGTYVSPSDTGTDPNDSDSDDDGLNDGAEVTLGTDPNDADSDDDGLTDGDEVNAFGTDPNDPDHDDDGYCDGSNDPGGGACPAGVSDNCPAVSNPSQANSDTLAAGDGCQCGDVDDIPGVTSADVDEVREALMGGDAVTNPDRCNVIGTSDGGVSDCDIADIFVLQRFLAGSPVTVANSCAAYTGGL